MEKFDDVVTGDDVFFPFNAGFARFSGCFAAFACHEIIVGDYLGPNESFLEIGVDFTCRLRGFGPLCNGPCTSLFFSGGVIGDQSEFGKGGFNKALEARFGNAE